MKKLIILLLFGIFLLGLVNAEIESLPPQKINTNIELKQIGADFSACNITSVSYPNSSIIFSDKTMTKRGNEYNYTLTSNYIKVLGKYVINGFCTNGSDDIVWAYDFEVTQSGMEKINSGEGLSLFGSIIVILVVGLFFFLISFKFEGSAGKIICVGFAGVIFLIAVLFSVVIMTQTFGGFSTLTESYSAFWMVLRIIFTVTLTFFTIYCFLIAFKLWKIKRGLIDVD